MVPLSEAHRELVFGVYSDERTWRHLPSGRHGDLRQTDALIRATEESWATTGLGWWAAFTTDPEDPAFVGVGGADLLEPMAWNLGYRLAPAHWGRGFATEIARAGMLAAARARPDWAVTARVLANNPASERVLHHLGLTLQWEGPRPGGLPTDSLGRIYSDRPLTGRVREWLIAHA